MSFGGRYSGTITGRPGASRKRVKRRRRATAAMVTAASRAASSIQKKTLAVGERSYSVKVPGSKPIATVTFSYGPSGRVAATVTVSPLMATSQSSVDPAGP